MFNRIFLFLLLLITVISNGKEYSPWQDIFPDVSKQLISHLTLMPNHYRLLILDEQRMREDLVIFDNMTKDENLSKKITLPLPNGKTIDLKIESTSVMEVELAARYPEINTYKVNGRYNNGIYGVVDISENGFHAMLFMQDGRRLFIDPRYSGNSTYYISYYDKDYHPHDKKPHSCAIQGHGQIPPSSPKSNQIIKRTGTDLITYRLAMSATGEYTQFQGGSKALALSAITTTISRINVIYERDLAIKMILIADTDQLIFTNASTDPFSNFNGVAMLTENQTLIQNTIGFANYDIGHVFSTGGGGIASLGVVCAGTAKARGVTGGSFPVGDPFDIDFVAHEVGHQFAGNHTFNSTTGSCGGSTRNASTAFEPGGGSTIQAYAGICGSTNNLQSNSDAMFHVKSIEQINDFVETGFGQFCGTSSSLNNQQPTVLAGGDFTIPINTPFELTAIGNDPDSDPLTYSWEQIDAGAATDVNVDVGDNALFRSFLPQTSAIRIFPRLANILNNTISRGEKLPVTNRTINFSVAIRDGVGGVNTDQMIITTTTGSDDFRITSHGSPAAFNAGDTTAVSWNVVNTNLPPVSCSNVDVLITTDGGTTFTNVSGGSTPNDGSQSVTIPANVADSTTTRFKVKCSGNVFFDISDVDLTTVSQTAISIIFSNGFE